MKELTLICDFEPEDAMTFMYDNEDNILRIMVNDESKWNIFNFNTTKLIELKNFFNECVELIK